MEPETSLCLLNGKSPTRIPPSSWRASDERPGAWWVLQFPEDGYARVDESLLADRAEVRAQPPRDPPTTTASPPSRLWLTAAVLLFCVAFIAGRYSIIQSWSLKRLKEKLMENPSSKEPPAGPAGPPPPAAVQVEPSPLPVQDPPKSQESQEPAPEAAEKKETPSEGTEKPETPSEGAEKKEASSESAEAAPRKDPAKVTWKSFLDVFRKRDPHKPFPEIEVDPDVVSAEQADALLEDEKLGVKELLDSCKDRESRREIARKFLGEFPRPESEWNAASLLLSADEDTTYWIAGDVHAKVSAIAKVCAVITDRRLRGLTKPRNVLILLGDFVDRGDEPLETLAFIEQLKMQPPDDGFEVVTLKGNHDVGLSRTGDGKYVSMVSPAETAEFLRACVESGEDVTVEADAAMRLAAVSPRMCELAGIDPDDRSRTMLFVHGGVPHVDLQEKLYEFRNEIPQDGQPFFKALASDAIPEKLRRGCAEDFTWIRLARDLPVKTPNRGSRGCEIGTEDVAQYLFVHRALTTRDITFIFRGHDHERAGFACYSPHDVLNPTKKKFAQRECHVLTLNAMEPDRSSAGMFRERDLALAEWTLGGPVRLHRIATHHIAATPPPPPEDRQPPQIQAEDLLTDEPSAQSAATAQEEQNPAPAQGPAPAELEPAPTELEPAPAEHEETEET